MDLLQREIRRKKSEYDRLLEKAQKIIDSAPQGRIRVSASHGKPTYYFRNQGERANEERYMSKKDCDRIKTLVEAEYAKKFVCELEKQIQNLAEFDEKYNPYSLSDVYNEMPIGKRNLFVPYIDNEEVIVKDWQDEVFVAKSYEPGTIEIYSEKGERVRSKSEKIIADKLYSMGVPYKYEAPLYLSGVGTVYPDFTLYNLLERKEMYWEHLGMMDKPEYAEKAVRKILSYEKNGIYPGQNLILTFETSKCPLNIRVVENMIANGLNLNTLY